MDQKDEDEMLIVNVLVPVLVSYFQGIFHNFVNW